MIIFILLELQRWNKGVPKQSWQEPKKNVWPEEKQLN